MALASDLIAQFLAPLFPSGDWRYQFGRWVGDGKTQRFYVLRPAGGVPASLVRRPTFTLMVIGRENDDFEVIAAAADSVVEATREGSGALIHLEAGEPVFHPTNDRRPVFEIAISAISD